MSDSQGTPLDRPLQAARRPKRGYWLGNPATRFAVTRAPNWDIRWPWSRPLGGWWVGRIIVWWSL